MYDFLIVGAGLYGSVFAQQCKEKGKTCLVIDKRDHIAGNVYSEKVEDIDVHRYGPHILNTNSDEAWEYIQRFTKINQYAHRIKVNYQDSLYSFPINLDTLYQVYGTKTPEEAQKQLDAVRVKIDNPRNLEEWCLAQIGPKLYEIFVKGYTTKQWRRKPRELPASIIKRIPIHLTYDDRYHDKKHSGIPEGGYTAWVTNILGDTKVELGADFFKIDWKKYAKRVVYSGKIDQLFDYCYGELEYRTLRFENKTLTGDYQGIATINYTEENIPYTRVTEHKHFNNHNQPNTVVTWEYPEEWHREATPYYPIADDKNNHLYQKYKALAEESDILTGGRLSSFKYIDMDATILLAIHDAKKVLC